jgi:3'-phosphoadenosine 5'-phosphosulfate sulfotransferase (PAPS reductase)/FAD synthetase
LSGDPFLVPPQSVVSFSGGRTSAYMLRRILDAFGGSLPPDRHVVFANTGRERAETLDFVAEVGARWSVPIAWLEYDADAEHKTAIVSHNSASRDGEPLAAIFKARSMLPNPVMRFCTIEGKVKRIQAYARHHLGYASWCSVVGLRADEMRRVMKQRNREASGKDGKGVGVPLMPLADAGITKRDVKAYWDASPFDLRLENVGGSAPEGNCDLCYLKTAGNIMGIMRRRPDLARWWIEQEAIAEQRGVARNPSVALFRMDRPSYRQMLAAVQAQGDFADYFGEMEGGSVDCSCTD